MKKTFQFCIAIKLIKVNRILSYKQSKNMFSPMAKFVRDEAIHLYA